MNAILPEWSLDDLFDPDSDKPLLDQMATALDDATALAEKHQGRLASYDGKTVNAILISYQRLSELTSRLTSFADLSFAADLSKPETSKLAQDTREAEHAILAKLVFIEHELAQMDDAVIERITAIRKCIDGRHGFGWCGHFGIISFRLNWKPCLLIASLQGGAHGLDSLMKWPPD